MILSFAILAAVFSFTPVPRWPVEPETEVVCAAVRAECPGFAGTTQIEAKVGCDELYDVAMMLSGMRIPLSTGCKPFDEHLTPSNRRF